MTLLYTYQSEGCPAALVTRWGLSTKCKVEVLKPGIARAHPDYHRYADAFERIVRDNPGTDPERWFRWVALRVAASKHPGRGLLFFSDVGSAPFLVDLRLGDLSVGGRPHGSFIAATLRGIDQALAVFTQPSIALRTAAPISDIGMLEAAGIIPGVSPAAA